MSQARKSLLFVMLGALAFMFVGVPLVKGQTAVPVQNPSFETHNALTTSPYCGGPGYNLGPIPSWNATGTGNFGSFLPGTGCFSSLPDGTAVAYTNGPTLTQDLGVGALANTTYTLTVYVGHRSDCCTGTATIQLLAGTVSLCSLSVNSANIPAGTFASQTLSCPVGGTPPSGNLIISLADIGTQSTFDAVSLNYVSSSPTITSLSPTSVIAGSSQFTLTITGTNFTGSTAFYWNGTALSCSNVSSTTETCTVPASLVTNGGAAFVTLAPTSGSVFTIQHQSALNWLAPNPVGGSGIVASYNVYRGTQTMGPYTLLTNSPSAAYNDPTVNSGYSYFYVVTTVDTNNVESLYSNEAVASIPIP